MYDLKSSIFGKSFITSVQVVIDLAVTGVDDDIVVFSVIYLLNIRSETSWFF